MKCNFCDSTDFEKEGRVWTCNDCGAEHVMDKTLTRVVSVHLTRSDRQININISGDSKIHGMCIGDNARVTQTIVTSGGGRVSGVTQRSVGRGNVIQQIIINED